MWKESLILYTRRNLPWILLTLFAVATGISSGIFTVMGLTKDRVAVLLGAILGASVGSAQATFTLFIKMWLISLQMMIIIWLCAYTRVGIPIALCGVWLRGAIAGFGIAVGWSGGFVTFLGLVLCTIVLSLLACFVTGTSFSLSLNRIKKLNPPQNIDLRHIILILMCLVPVAWAECQLLPVVLNSL